MEWATQGSQVLGTYRYQGLTPKPRNKACLNMQTQCVYLGMGVGEETKALISSG